MKCFSTEGNARAHYVEMHLMIKYLCHQCPALYASFQHLKYHIRVTHEFNSIVSIQIYFLIFRWRCNVNYRLAQVHSHGSIKNIHWLQSRANGQIEVQLYEPYRLTTQ